MLESDALFLLRFFNTYPILMPARIFDFLLVLLLLLHGSAFSQALPRAVPDAKVPRDFLVGMTVGMTMEQRFGLNRDAEMQTRVRDIGYRVAASIGHPKTVFVFNVLDMPDPNAVALPGGFIYITKGLLDLDLTDDELAQVLAHECSHVIREHHKRIQKSAMLANLINAAVLAGAIIGAQSNSSYRSTTALGSDGYGRGATGRSQQILSAAVLSGMATNLFLLRYVREYEIEADRTGRSLAAGAGFDPHGSADMLAKLLSRSYQRPGMGIVRTHPYLQDRIALANGESKNLRASPSPRPPLPLRNHVQEMLLYRATTLRDQGQWNHARFLLRNAYAASPHGPLADDVNVQVLLWREGRQKEQAFLNRDWGYFVHAYHEILKEFPHTDRRSEIEAKLTYFEKQEMQFYPQHLRRLDFDDVIPAFGEYFVRNYPDDPRIVEARYKLGEAYRKGRKYERSAKLLFSLLEESPGKPWTVKIKHSFRLLLPKLKKIGLAYKYFLTVDNAKKEKAEILSEIQVLIRKSTDIEDLGQFRVDHPGTQVDPSLVERLSELSRATLARARFLRRTKNYSAAAFEYYKVNRYSPDRQLATVANQELEEMQSLQ